MSHSIYGVYTFLNDVPLKFFMLRYYALPMPAAQGLQMEMSSLHHFWCNIFIVCIVPVK